MATAEGSGAGEKRSPSSGTETVVGPTAAGHGNKHDHRVNGGEAAWLVETEAVSKGSWEARVTALTVPGSHNRRQVLRREAAWPLVPPD